MKADPLLAPPPPLRLVVLPFTAMGEAERDQRLAAGLTNDLITDLAAVPSLGVVAADSVQAAAAQTDSELSLVGKLQAEYMVRGSLRRHGEKLRINAQLLDTQGHHVWGGRFDEEDLPTVLDELVGKLLNALISQVDHSLLQSARRRAPSGLHSYECWLLGMESLQRGTADCDAEARKLFEAALQADPHDHRAYAGISLSHFNDWSCQAWERWETKERLAYDYALRAETLYPDDPFVQLILGRIEQYRRQFHRAAPRLENALRLAPNDARILIQLAGSFTYQGNATLGLELADRALLLQPLAPGWYYNYAAAPLFALRRYEEALEVGAKAPPRLVVDAPAYQAAAAAFLKRTKEATRYLQEFREDFLARICQGREPEPDELLRWIVHVNPFRREDDTKHLVEGLRLAGLEGDWAKPTATAPVPWSIANTFRKEGGLWTLCYEHQAVQLPDLRGLHDLARLLAAPGEEISCLDLAAVGLHAKGVEKTDPQALKSYRNRLREIESDLQTATEFGDPARATRLHEEKEALLKEIREIAGLGGRIRQSGGVAEKARTSVAWRIRHAIRKVAEVHPALGRHLANSIRTGLFCRYAPEAEIRWSF